MTGPTWGHCDECGDLASIKPVDGTWMCPDCRFYLRHPEEAPADKHVPQP